MSSPSRRPGKFQSPRVLIDAFIQLLKQQNQSIDQYKSEQEKAHNVTHWDAALNQRAENENLPGLRVLPNHARFVRSQGDCMLDTLLTVKYIAEHNGELPPQPVDIINRATQANQLRADIVRWLRNEGSLFETVTTGDRLPLTAQGLAFMRAGETWEQMCNTFSQNGAWLENVALQAAACVLKRDIFLLNSNLGGVFSFFVSGNDTQPSAAEALYIGNWAMLHYVPMSFMDAPAAPAPAGNVAAVGRKAGDGFDILGFYADVQGNGGVHSSRGKPQPVIVHRSQYNVGRELVRRASTMVGLGLLNAADAPIKQFGKLNFMFIGPSFTALREQTRRDLDTLLHYVFHMEPKQLDDIRANFVLNNNALQKNKKDVKKQLKDHKWSSILMAHQEMDAASFDNDEYLHILIFDEAHWGIASEGTIDAYFTELADFLEQNAKKTGRTPNLLILKVSATIDVLIQSVEGYASEQGNRVDWNKLRQQPRFAAPSYRTWSDLQLHNDARAELLEATTLTVRSDLVVKEYLFVMEVFFRWLLGAPAQPNERQLANSYCGWRILCQILPLIYDQKGQLDREKIMAAACETRYSEAHGNNHTVLVRLDGIQQVQDLRNGLRRFIADMQHKDRGGPTFQPFEVLALADDDGSLWDQLSEKGHFALSPLGVEPAGGLTAEGLVGLPCILLVCDRLAMGERLTPACTAFDVRGRYSGDVSKIKSNMATFVQDIGRCAGHGKQNATIYTAVSDKNQVAAGKNQPTIQDFVFQKLHGLLTTKHVPSSLNPESDKGSKAFSRLSRFCLILDAEPQIGKTGAVLSMLEILFKEHVRHSEEEEEEEEEDPWPKESVLRTVTAHVSKLFDTDGTIDDRVQAVMDYYKQNDNFAPYHALIGEHSEMQNLSTLLVSWADDVVDIAAAMHNEDDDPVNLIVVDGGCGMHGMVQIFRQLEGNQQLQQLIDQGRHVRIHGFDLDEKIREQEADNNASAVQFKAHVADMIANMPKAENDLKNGCVHAVVYNLSLMETDITRHIRRAHELLQFYPFRGHLVIADVASRFPPDFAARITAVGFSVGKGTEVGPFKLFKFKKGNRVFTDPQEPIQLKLYTGGKKKARK